jgi:predicted DNA binding protein
VSIIVEVTVPADTFALGHALGVAPAVSVSAERMSSHARNEALPYLWAVDGTEQLDTLETAADDDDTVETFDCVDRSEPARLYHVIWSDAVSDRLRSVLDNHGVILEADARADTWHLKFRFNTHDDVQTFRDTFIGSRTGVTVERLFSPETPRQGEYNLTARQQRAVLAAFKQGYFNAPRDVELRDLADEFDISTNAMSERLRRAVSTLVSNTIDIDASTQR